MCFHPKMRDWSGPQTPQEGERSFTLREGTLGGVGLMGRRESPLGLNVSLRSRHAKKKSEKGCSTCVHDFPAAKEAPKPASLWREGGRQSLGGGASDGHLNHARAPFLDWDKEGARLSRCLVSFICESRGRGRIIGKDSCCCLASSKAPSWKAVLVFFYGFLLTCPFYSIPSLDDQLDRPRFFLLSFLVLS